MCREGWRYGSAVEADEVGSGARGCGDREREMFRRLEMVEERLSVKSVDSKLTAVGQQR